MYTAALTLLLQDAPQTVPVWLLVIIAIVLIILFIWLILRWRETSQASSAARRVAPIEEKAAAPVPAVPVVAPEPAAPVEEPAPAPVVDDLEIIEGIGPKIAAVLKAAGVTSFAQLAGMAPEAIGEMLKAGGIRLADPGSWPEQARLAAAGDQQGLEELQKRLTAGRN